MKVIEEMTDKMRVVFKENFSMLRKNFNETFKELFKGGSADLILTDGDELTSKIDINVEPPGKETSKYKSFYLEGKRYYLQ